MTTLYRRLNGALYPVRKRTWTPSPADDADRDPENLSAPTIVGVAEVGQVVTATEGSWRFARVGAFTYQWKRDGVAIPGAEEQSYEIVADDGGTDLTVTVTARNMIGPVEATSAPSAVP